MIILHVTYTAKEGQGKGFVEEMAASGIQRRVKAEQGNIMYDYFYSAESPDKVLLLEKWESGEALETHLNGDCIRDIKPIKAKYIAESAIERFEV